MDMYTETTLNHKVSYEAETDINIELSFSWEILIFVLVVLVCLFIFYKIRIHERLLLYSKNDPVENEFGNSLSVGDDVNLLQENITHDIQWSGEAKKLPKYGAKVVSVAVRILKKRK